MTPIRFRRLLGIAADADIDAAAIRRAYADRLRALDVDADPQGFADLRRARDTALAYARGDVETDAFDNDPDWFETEPDLETGDDRSDTQPVEPIVHVPPPAERLVVVDPDRDRTADRSDERAAAIWALLLPEEGEDAPPLTDDQSAALHDHVDALLASPRLEEIDYRTRAESWFAELVADAGWRADPILPRVVDFFGWAQSRGRLDQPWAVAAALDRYDQHHFLADIVKPGHPHRTAWNVLSGGQAGLRNLFVRKKRVRELLGIIRRDHPDLEMLLDHDRVAQWEHGRIGGWRTTVLAIWFAIIALRLVAFAFDGGSTPTPVVSTRPPALRSFEQDIGPLMTAVGGPTLTLAALRQQNPAYHAALVARWNDGLRVESEPASFLKGVVDDLIDRYVAGLRVANIAIVRQARQLELDQLILARDRLGTLACLDLSMGYSMPQLVERQFSDRRRRLIADVALNMGDVAPGKRKTSFAIPGIVMEGAARRAGMTIPAFDVALDRKGDSGKVCAAWIALYQTALAQPPKAGAKLLRAM